jgi:hypothetical protein
MSAVNEIAMASVLRAIRKAGVPGMGDYTARCIAAAAIEAVGAIRVSQIDHDMIAGSFARALAAGAPGLSADIQRAVVVSAMVRVRHALGVVSA